jgi:hypothetical protein
MILKFDPRKTLNTTIADNKLPIHLRQEIRGRYYFLQNDETGSVYATLEKTAPTEWKIKVYEMVFDKKTLKLKPAAYYDYNVFQEKTVDCDNIMALVPIFKKYANEEKFLRERKNKIIALFEQTFG